MDQEFMDIDYNQGALNSNNQNPPYDENNLEYTNNDNGNYNNGNNQNNYSNQNYHPQNQNQYHYSNKNPHPPNKHAPIKQSPQYNRNQTQQNYQNGHLPYQQQGNRTPNNAATPSHPYNYPQSKLQHPQYQQQNQSQNQPGSVRSNQPQVNQQQQQQNYSNDPTANSTPRSTNNNNMPAYSQNKYPINNNNQGNSGARYQDQPPYNGNHQQQQQQYGNQQKNYNQNPHQQPYHSQQPGSVRSNSSHVSHRSELSQQQRYMPPKQQGSNHMPNNNQVRGNLNGNQSAVNNHINNSNNNNSNIPQNVNQNQKININNQQINKNNGPHPQTNIHNQHVQNQTHHLNQHQAPNYMQTSQQSILSHHPPNNNIEKIQNIKIEELQNEFYLVTYEDFRFKILKNGFQNQKYNYEDTNYTIKQNEIELSYKNEKITIKIKKKLTTNIYTVVKQFYERFRRMMLFQQKLLPCLNERNPNEPAIWTINPFFVDIKLPFPILNNSIRIFRFSHLVFCNSFEKDYNYQPFGYKDENSPQWQNLFQTTTTLNSISATGENWKNKIQAEYIPSYIFYKYFQKSSKIFEMQCFQSPIIQEFPFLQQFRLIPSYLFKQVQCIPQESSYVLAIKATQSLQNSEQNLYLASSVFEFSFENNINVINIFESKMFTEIHKQNVREFTSLNQIAYKEFKFKDPNLKIIPIDGINDEHILQYSFNQSQVVYNRVEGFIISYINFLYAMAKLNYLQLVFPKSELIKSSQYQLKINLFQEIQGNSNAQNQDLIPTIFIEVLDIQNFFEILQKNQNQNQNAMTQQKIAMLQEQQQNQIKLQLYNVKIKDNIYNPENNSNQHTTFYRYICQIFDQMLLLEPKYIRNAIILWSKGEQLRDNVKKNLATFGIKTFENRFNCKKFLIESLKLKFDLSIKRYIIENLTIKDASDFRIENDRFICRDQNIDLDKIQFSRQIDQFLEIYFSNRRI